MSRFQLTRRIARSLSYIAELLLKTQFYSPDLVSYRN